MATKSENADIAVLQIQMSGVQTDITDIKTDIKEIKTALEGKFVTQEQFTEYKKSQAWQKVSIAIASVVLGGLVTYFFTHIGG